MEHEGALHVAVAVQARRQPEVPFEQRAGAPEQIENILLVHASRSLPHEGRKE